MLLPSNRIPVRYGSATTPGIVPAERVGGFGASGSSNCEDRCRTVADLCYLACGLTEVFIPICLYLCKSAKDDCIDDCKSAGWEYGGGWGTFIY